MTPLERAEFAAWRRKLTPRGQDLLDLRVRDAERRIALHEAVAFAVGVVVGLGAALLWTT